MVEWYTPVDVIEAARRTMGGIDLDPASCKEANLTVNAKTFYTIEDDGLSLPWSGRVWLNPPFGAKDTKAFCGKLVSSYRDNKVEQGCLLIPYVPGSKHVSILFSMFLHVHEGPSRIRFMKPGGGRETIQFPIVIFYLGSNETEFCSNFRIFGAICQPCAEYSPNPTLF